MSLKPDLYKSKFALAGIGGWRMRCAIHSYPASAALGLNRWASKDVTYRSDFELPGISRAQVNDHFDAACSEWNSVCGIKLQRVASGGNIQARAGRIDGRMGTLAYSYLPNAPSPMDDVCEQVYDNSESWTAEFVRGVIKHEVGHAIGFDHSNSQSSIMYPYSNGRNDALSSEDIQGAVARYGNREVAVPPSPTEVYLQIVVNGVAYGVKLEPM